MATSRTARLSRMAIVLVCTLLAIGIRGFVAWTTPALVEEQRTIAAGAHLLAHHDARVTAFADDTPAAAYAASLPWLGLREGLPPHDTDGPPEQVGWSALHGTPAADSDATPREVLDAHVLLRSARAPGLLAVFLAIVATTLLAESLFGRAAALVAGATLALDPLTALQGGLAVAEPWAQAGTAWLMLAAAAHWETVVGGTDRRPGRERRSSLGLGVAFGCAALASVTVWPVALVTGMWLAARAGAATRRDDAFRRGRSGRFVTAAVAFAAVVVLGCLATHPEVLIQPAQNAVSGVAGFAGSDFLAAAPYLAWPALFALIATPWLFRDRADHPALLLAVLLAAAAVAVVAPGRLALPALAAATPPIAVLAGCGAARLGQRSKAIAAAVALLVFLPGCLLALAVHVSARFPADGPVEFEPVMPTDRDHDDWFVQRYVEQRRPRVLHRTAPRDSGTVTILESTRIVHHTELDAKAALALLEGDGVVVVLPHPAPAPLRERVAVRARGIVFLE